MRRKIEEGLEVLRTYTRVRVTLNMELTGDELDALVQSAQHKSLSVPEFCESVVLDTVAKITDYKERFPLKAGEWFTRGYVLPHRYRHWIDTNSEVQTWLEDQDERDYEREADEAYDEWIDDEVEAGSFPFQWDEDDFPIDGEFDGRGVGSRTDEMPDEVFDELEEEHLPALAAERRRREAEEYEGDYEPDFPRYEADLRPILKGKQLGRTGLTYVSKALGRIHVVYDTRPSMDGATISCLCGRTVFFPRDEWIPVDFEHPLFEDSMCLGCLAALRRRAQEKSETPLADAVKGALRD